MEVGAGWERGRAGERGEGQEETKTPKEGGEVSEAEYASMTPAEGNARGVRRAGGGRREEMWLPSMVVGHVCLARAGE